MTPIFLPHFTEVWAYEPDKYDLWGIKMVFPLFIAKLGNWHEKGCNARRDQVGVGEICLFIFLHFSLYFVFLEIVFLR